jgi:uncharacterized protein YciI
MALYVFLCAIDQTKLDLFARLRAEHYGFLIAERDRIRFGGPARVAEGGRPETMIIVADAPDEAEAQAWIAREPYNANGGFASIVVRPFSQVIPEAEPGLLARTRADELAKRGGG